MPPTRGRGRGRRGRRAEVAGDGPGVEERYSGRVVGVSDEEQGVEDAAGREDAGRVDDEGEDAGDEARPAGRARG